MPAPALQAVVVNVGRGDIQIVDATRARVCGTGALYLDARTGSGIVQLPRE
jgi:hypothetical protein